MNTLEKIKYIIDNEGTELAEGLEGLIKFFNYVCPDDYQQPILDILEDSINVIYKEIKEEVEGNRNTWYDLPHACTFKFNGESYVKVNRNLLTSLGAEKKDKPFNDYDILSDVRAINV